jgi:cell division protein ZapA
MTTTQFCTIRVLNKSYQIKCPDEEMDNLNLAAQKLNDYLNQNKDSTKRLDDYQALLMAALHVSHELVTCLNQQSQQRNQLAQFINTLENAVGGISEDV